MTQHFYLIAGEASGDFLGAQLMRSIKHYVPACRFSGVGGAKMQAEGLNSLFPMNELSLMGLFEILPKIFHLLRRIDQTAQDIITQKPDMVITIDAPDFSFRVQKKVRRVLGKNAPLLVHYVAPTVWAWRPKRAKKIARFLDALICLFHFEPPYFTREGLKAISVGHPIMESGLVEAVPLFISKAKHLGVFFGSRHSEVARLSPILIEALQIIQKTNPDLELVIPTLPHLESDIRQALNQITLPYHLYSATENKWSVFKSCDAAIAVSGTVGLELSAADVPHLIAYKMNALTAFIARRMIKTRFAHLGNIILNREVVPEFIQEHCSAQNIAQRALALLDDNQEGMAQKIAFEEVRQHISGKTKEISPSHNAAEYLFNLLASQEK